MVVFDWPKIGYAWVGANRILAGPGNRRSRGNHSQKRRYRRARGRCSDHRSTKDRKNWVISFVPTPSQKTILHLWMLGLKPLAVSEPWRAESDWCLAVKPSQFYARFGILNVTYNIIIIKIFKAYHNDLVHNTYRAEFPFEFPTIVCAVLLLQIHNWFS